VVVNASVTKPATVMPDIGPRNANASDALLEKPHLDSQFQPQSASTALELEFVAVMETVLATVDSEDLDANAEFAKENQPFAPAMVLAIAMVLVPVKLAGPTPDPNAPSATVPPNVLTTVLTTEPASADNVSVKDSGDLYPIALALILADQNVTNVKLASAMDPALVSQDYTALSVTRKLIAATSPTA